MSLRDVCGVTCSVKKFIDEELRRVSLCSCVHCDMGCSAEPGIGCSAGLSIARKLRYATTGGNAFALANTYACVHEAEHTTDLEVYVIN